MKKSLAVLAASLLAIGLHAQDGRLNMTGVGDEGRLSQVNWDSVRSLYDAGMYMQTLNILKGNPDPLAKGYSVLCALNLKQENAHALALKYLELYPEGILTPQIHYTVALDLFDAERYAEALDHFGRIEMPDLQKSQQAEYTYKMGYSAFGAGETERAKGLLGRIQGLPYSDYTAPAYYTLGYIEYAAGRFGAASEWFQKAAQDHRFAALANYYILECRFNEKDYAYVIKFGEDLFNKVPEDRQPHMARIMSESYLVLGDVEKARSYYMKNLREKGKLTRSDYFYAGEVNYLVEDWQAAVDNFGRMESRRDSLGQIASYQMGYSYIKLRNKVAAMDAFKEASELDYTPDIKEDATYNYAKLAFDLGRDTKPFQDYLSRYGTKKGNSIYSYMAMAALQNHDYEAAVAAYDQIDDLDPGMQSNYMKAYLLRAVELMENGSWRAAIPHLKAAAYYSPRKDGFNQLARYYQAEALYRDGKWGEARTILTDLYNLSALPFTKEGSLIPYQLAYTYFKEADYQRALKWFQSYMEGDSSAMGADAQTRIADCYFFGGDYRKAVAAYERQMASYPDPDNLYPRFRAGVACGLLEDNQQKVRFLEDVKQANPQAPYYGESLYELGRAYVALKDSEDAIRAFRTLRATTSDPALATKALLELGMLERNAGRTDQALDYYKQVVAQGGDYTEDALLAIEAIYRTREDPEAYLAYVNSLGDKANRSEAQKEEVYFSSAEQIYLSGDYLKAQTSLLAYLQKYPMAIYGAKARYYLADCYRLTGAREQACDLYRSALESGLEGSLTESATSQLAQLEYALGNYAKAYESYAKLAETARLDENRALAVIGLMRSAYRAHSYEDAIASAQGVMETFPAEAALQREAKWVKAKSFLSTSRRDQAMPLLEELAAEPSTDEGAESAFLLIQDMYDRAQFKEIQKAVYAFAEKASGQNYWLAKAFIVLGDSFAEEGNMAQAKATFESIRNGYSSSGPQDDVLDQVDLRLSKMQ